MNHLLQIVAAPLWILTCKHSRHWNPWRSLWWISLKRAAIVPTTASAKRNAETHVTRRHWGQKKHWMEIYNFDYFAVYFKPTFQPIELSEQHTSHFMLIGHFIECVFCPQRKNVGRNASSFYFIWMKSIRHSPYFIFRSSWQVFIPVPKSITAWLRSHTFASMSMQM